MEDNYNNDLGKDIPIKRNMPIKLKKTTPSGYPISLLKTQLTNLGLACGETSEENLKIYKETVMSKFKVGSRQVYGFYSGNTKKSVAYSELFDENGWFRLQGEDFLGKLGISPLSINGSWTPEDDAGGYRTKLCTIIFSDNFDYLKNNFSDFNGQTNEKNTTINEPTGSVIRDTFTTMALSVCAVVQAGIAVGDLETMISAILGANQSQNPHDYEMNNVLYCYMVNGYDPEEAVATAVGVLSLTYKITIKDYKDKSDHKDGRHNDAYISIRASFVSYSDLEPMNRDLARITARAANFLSINDSKPCLQNDLYIVDDIPIPEKKIVVYNKKPAATGSVFQTGMPLVNTGPYADTLIFFCPDLESIGCIDNVDSDATASYSKSITVGFEKTDQISISMETSLELDVEFVKFGIKMGISTTMSSSWNHSQTETISFELAGGKMAYLYQGIMHSIILRYDPQSASYKFVGGSENRFLTNTVKTTNKPILLPK